MDCMTNLLTETLEILTENGKTPADVHWVGSRSGVHTGTWEEFADLADREYDKGFGMQEVAGDLVIVGHGWWLERRVYDGFERWQFVLPPKKHSKKKITCLFPRVGETVL